MSALSPFEHMGETLLEVSLPVALLVIFFLVFEFLFLKRPVKQILFLLRGVGFAFVGLVLFLQGIHIALLPMGTAIGEAFASFHHQWTLIPLGFFLGFLITLAEPQVRILSQQVEEASGGYIRAPMILYTLCGSVAVFAAVGMARALYGFPFIYIVIPGYAAALFLLTVADREFVSIAFDAGNVATGPMTVAFLVSLAVGTTSAIEGRNTLTDGFGLIGTITLAPILALQILSLAYRTKSQRGEAEGE